MQTYQLSLNETEALMRAFGESDLEIKLGQDDVEVLATVQEICQVIMDLIEAGHLDLVMAMCGRLSNVGEDETLAYLFRNLAIHRD